MSGPAKAAAASLTQLAQASDMSKHSVNAMSVDVAHSSAAMASMSGAAGASGGGLASLTAATGPLAIGLTAVAGAVAVTIGLFGSLALAGAHMALEATEGKQAMIGMFSALGGGVSVGQEVEEMLGGLSDKIGITKDELAPLTKSFMAMGVEGTAALEKITLAAISAQAIMGDPSAAKAFESLTAKIQVAAQTGNGLKIPEKGLKSLAEMGLRVDDVAKQMNVSSKTLAAQLAAGSVNAKQFGDALQNALIEKGAGPLQIMGSKLSNLKKMFGQSVEDMFEDLGKSTGPFLVQLKSLLSIFSQNTASGRAMKTSIEGAFQGIFAAATRVVPYIKHFFLDVIIWSLEAYIAIKENWTTIESVMTGVGIAVGLVAVPMLLIAATIAAPFIIATSAVVALGVGLAWLAGTLTSFAVDAEQAGVNIVSGLVNGIMGGLGRIKDAAVAMGKSALDGVQGFLGMHSPSTVMLKMGGFTAEPFAAGIQGGADKVSQAGRDLGAAATGGTSEGMNAADYKASVTSRGGDSGKGGGTTFNGGITLTIQAPQGVTNALELTETALATLFERLALQQGL